MPAARPLILVVEDEPPIAETLVYALETEGFAALWKTTARDALAAIAAHEIALVVLDVGLPDGNGFDVCRELRRHRNVPVIFLTARSSEVDRVVGLEIGADDYMAKPFSPRELTARVRAVLRRTQASPLGVGAAAAVNGSDERSARAAATTVSGPTPTWSHDAARCRISFCGRALDLTRNEYRLLAALLAHPGRIFTRDQLMTMAWDDPGAALDRTVDAHVKMLRAKLREISAERDPIATHRGMGYALREET